MNCDKRQSFAELLSNCPGGLFTNAGTTSRQPPESAARRRVRPGTRRAGSTGDFAKQLMAVDVAPRPDIGKSSDKFRLAFGVNFEAVGLFVPGQHGYSSAFRQRVAFDDYSAFDHGSDGDSHGASVAKPGVLQPPARR